MQPLSNSRKLYGTAAIEVTDTYSHYSDLVTCWNIVALFQERTVIFVLVNKSRPAVGRTWRRTEHTQHVDKGAWASSWE